MVPSLGKIEHEKDQDAENAKSPTTQAESSTNSKSPATDAGDKETAVTTGDVPKTEDISATQTSKSTKTKHSWKHKSVDKNPADANDLKAAKKDKQDQADEKSSEPMPEEREASAGLTPHGELPIIDTPPARKRAPIATDAAIDAETEKSKSSKTEDTLKKTPAAKNVAEEKEPEVMPGSDEDEAKKKAAAAAGIENFGTLNNANEANSNASKKIEKRRRNI